LPFLRTQLFWVTNDPTNKVVGASFYTLLD
jgi:hypothetical protein